MQQDTTGVMGQAPAYAADYPVVSGGAQARCPCGPRALCSLHKVSFFSIRKDRKRWQPAKTGWVALFSVRFKEIIVGNVLREEEWGPAFIKC